MRITNIQPFSLDDGPGIRTTVFMSGCNLKCRWCHNPENLEYGKNDYEISEKQLLEKILQDEAVMKYSVHGGVTFSGGEPLMQKDELKNALINIKDHNLSTAVETAGNYEFEILREILPYTDLLIIDCKAFSPDIHERCTGKDNWQILNNIRKINEEKMRFWVRVPIIPPLNASYDEMDKIGNFLKDINAERIELISYHKGGVSKYQKLGMKYLADMAEIPTKKYMEQCKRILSVYNLKVYLS